MPQTREIQACEERLRAAMIASDVPELDELIDDELVFTAPTGEVLSKAQDLRAHRDGILRIARLELFESRLHEVGDLVIATTKARLKATYAGHPVAGVFGYTRVWRESANGWRVVAGHSSRLGDLG
nr:nuclear transport factor 2 family protein [uncultured Pseudomonas sp.]